MYRDAWSTKHKIWFLITAFLCVFVCCFLFVYLWYVWVLSLYLALWPLCQDSNNKELDYYYYYYYHHHHHHHHHIISYILSSLKPKSSCPLSFNFIFCKNIGLTKVCCNASCQDIKVSDASVVFFQNFAIRRGGRADGNKFNP